MKTRIEILLWLIFSGFAAHAIIINATRKGLEFRALDTQAIQQKATSAPAPIPAPGKKIPDKILKKMVNDTAQNHGLPAQLIMAVAKVESDYRQVVANEPNGTKSYCAMQVNDALARDYNVTGRQLMNDLELCLHIGASRLSGQCAPRIRAAKGVESKLAVAYGCYRGTHSDYKLVNYFRKLGQLNALAQISYFKNKG